MRGPELPGAQLSFYPPPAQPDELLYWLWLAHTLGPASAHAGRVMDWCGGDARYACPVVGGYPEVLRLNLLSTFPKVSLMAPFIDLEREDSVLAGVRESFPELPVDEVREAFRAGREALMRYRDQLHALGEERAALAHAKGVPLIVLAGHP